jgi:hypothetical protein
MAMITPKRPNPMQQRIEQYLSLKIFEEAHNLAERYQKGDAFRLYVAARMHLVIPAVVAFLLVSIACTAATVVFLVGSRSWLMLPSLVLAPLILIGSLFVQVYVFFSWLELRALARALGHAAKPAAGTLPAWLPKIPVLNSGNMPPVPWGLAAIFLFAPLVILAKLSWLAALALVVLAAVAPVLCWRLDR